METFSWAVEHNGLRSRNWVTVLLEPCYYTISSLRETATLYIVTEQWLFMADLYSNKY